MNDERRKREDKRLHTLGRRASDARGGRPTRRAFRPLRWAWLLLLVALLAPAYDLFLPAGYHPARERRTVVIEHGQSLHEIARELQRMGVIRSQAGFLVLARMMHLDRSVKAGQYSFKLGTTVPALLRALDRGMYGLNLVTIPEGLMVSETAALIQREVGISAASIDSLASDPMLLDSLEVGAPSLEGWLAPDSYEWLPGTSPEVVLRTMVGRTRERVQRATAGYDSLPLGMNAHEVLTLASIVESESRAKEERPHIARVYLNRLDRGMLLQADPTVGYALGRGPRSRLTFKDLRAESPYNTYRHEGLPPGPICSPGLAAIEAVMSATPNAKDLYFVARGEGRHLFAPTYEQHLANIAYVRGKNAALAARTNPNAASEAEPDAGGEPGGEPATPLAVDARPTPVVPPKGPPTASHGIIKAAANTPPQLAVVTPLGPHVTHPDSAKGAEYGPEVVRPAASAAHAVADSVKKHAGKSADAATASSPSATASARTAAADSARGLATKGKSRAAGMVKDGAVKDGPAKVTAVRDSTLRKTAAGTAGAAGAAKATARDSTLRKPAAGATGAAGTPGAVKATVRDSTKATTSAKSKPGGDKEASAKSGSAGPIKSAPAKLKADTTAADKNH